MGRSKHTAQQRIPPRRCSNFPATPAIPTFEPAFPKIVLEFPTKAPFLERFNDLFSSFFSEWDLLLIIDIDDADVAADNVDIVGGEEDEEEDEEEESFELLLSSAVAEIVEFVLLVVVATLDWVVAEDDTTEAAAAAADCNTDAVTSLTSSWTNIIDGPDDVEDELLLLLEDDNEPEEDATDETVAKFGAAVINAPPGWSTPISRFNTFKTDDILFYDWALFLY